LCSLKPTWITRPFQKPLPAAIIWQAAAETEKLASPSVPGLYEPVLATLRYLRRNRVQAKIAESPGVSQPTASRSCWRKPDPGCERCWRSRTCGKGESHAALAAGLGAGIATHPGGMSPRQRC
jgi:hypothetical protein